jgi:hypothetical protein
MPEKETNPNPTTDQVRAYCYAVATPINSALAATLDTFDIPVYEKMIGLFTTTLNAADQILNGAMRGGDLEAALVAKRLCTQLANFVSDIAYSVIAAGETVTPYDVDAYLKAIAEAQAAEVAAV